ncbi:hypothetical protein JTE90_027889 [Oedothorax gibbosus]|uniref:Uncharacterized protein n=1 Tax=Oedothorax gibbosus TaxID=931172 RepID=A0AAV6U9F2_9ARAC|nr:hypothetical protein JTE90_027889 [Oedothorax gibbosus]
MRLSRCRYPYYNTYSFHKRPVDDATMARNVLSVYDQEGSYEGYGQPGVMKNYLAMLSRLAKKNLATEDRQVPNTAHSPKRDNKKFQTQGW